MMSIFDRLKSELKSNAASAVSSAVQSLGTQRETITFRALPESLAEMQALPEASLDSPFKTAALAVCALCAYAADKQIGLEMLNWLRGPRPLGNSEIAFMDERFKEEKTYIPFSYFKGATPQNDYTPDEPYSVTVYAGPYSDQNKGYKALFIDSGGADSARGITLRQLGDGRWMLWEQGLLVDIRKPKSKDPWM